LAVGSRKQKLNDFALTANCPVPAADCFLDMRAPSVLHRQVFRLDFLCILYQQPYPDGFWRGYVFIDRGDY
jgi:hypothetical protein